jgi:peroxiredoxin
MYSVKSTLTIPVILAMSLLLGCGSGSPSPKNASAQPENETALAQANDSRQASDFSLTTLSGDNITLDTYSGKVLIIDFWATWCPPCVKEIPHFVELYDQYSDKGVEILGVSVDRHGPSVVQKFMDKNGVKYPIAMANMEIVDAYEAYGGIPTTFIIDRNGKITEKVVGYRDKQYFEERIKNLL